MKAKEPADHAIFFEDGFIGRMEGPFYKSAINPILQLRSYKGRKVRVFRLVEVPLVDVPDVITTYHKEIEE